MTTDEQVTHPPVTHPETITLKLSQEGAAKAPRKPASTRADRRRLRMPPPKVIAAVALVVAALELLIWQVGGLWWGLGIHAALIVLAMVPVGVLAFIVWRRRRAGRRAGTQATHKTTATGATSQRRGPFGKLFGPGRKSRSGAGSPAGGRKPGLLGKLFPGRGRGGKSPSGSRAGSGRPSGGKRNPLGKLFGPSRKSPAGGGKASPGGRRSPGGSRFRNPFKGRPAAKGSGSSPAGKGKRKASGSAPSRGKKGRFWPDLLKGVREGAAPKPAAQEKRKPSPGPSAAKPASAQKVQPAEPKHAGTEQMVREAVKRAADANPASVTPQHTGGTNVGGMDRIRSAAEELAGALKDYDEEDMHNFVKEFPQLGEAFSGISGGIKQMASRAETEWPTAAPFAEGLRSMASDVKAAAGTAEEAKGTLRRENETDIERGEAPRGGSRRIEGRWNV